MSSRSVKEHSTVEVVNEVQRRRWPVSEKLRIVEESTLPGLSISYVARKYGLSPSLLYRWRQLMSDGDKQAATDTLPPVKTAEEEAQDKQNLIAAIKKLDKSSSLMAVETSASRTRRIWPSSRFTRSGTKPRGLLQKMVEGKLIDDTTDVTCYVSVPTTDKLGNQNTKEGIRLTWAGVILNKINWKNMFAPTVPEPLHAGGRAPGDAGDVCKIRLRRG